MCSIELGKREAPPSSGKITLSNGDLAYLIDKSSGHRANYWSKERCHAINRHWTDEDRSKKVEGQFLITITGLFASNTVPLNREAHLPTFADEKRSLTEPPATDRNAAPQRPVTKRKKMRTAGGIEKVV